MTAIESAVGSEDEARSIVTTRRFDAPRELVFDTFTDRAHISEWWGPHGFTTTTDEMDVRPGGTWRFVMHGPDGTDYENEILYRVVERPSRLEYHHRGAEGDPHRFDVTIDFTEEEGGTRVTLRILVGSPEIREELVRFGAIEGGQQTLARLAELLERRASAPFTIERTVDAPRELVFRAWTEREHLMQWFGPKGFTMAHCANDPRPGGVMHYRLVASNGMEMWGRWAYREIVPPERLVFVSSFSDREANVRKAPFPGDWPAEMLTTVTFDERGGRTLVTLRSEAINATAAQRETFTAHHAAMNASWGGTFDQLDAHVRRT